MRHTAAVGTAVQVRRQMDTWLLSPNGYTDALHLL